MNRKTKRMITVLAVIVLIIVAASIVLRVLLTRERLIAMIVPRIERSIDAKISIGDMGVRFPFGFGVNASDISFDKVLPGGGRLVVSSSRAAVDVSLLSLIRKRPDVKRIDVDGADIDFSGPEGMPTVALNGIRGQFSMLPGDSVYVIGADMKITSVRLKKGEGGAAVEIGDVVISSVVESSFDFDDFYMRESDITVGGVFEAALTARIVDVQEEGSFDIMLESGETDIVRLLDYAGTSGFASFMPTDEGKEPGGLLPAEISSGSLKLKAAAKGSLKNPAGAVTDGTLVLTGIEGADRVTGIPFSAGGTIAFSDTSVKSEGFSVSSGASSLNTSFAIVLGEDRKPVRIDIEAKIKALAEDLAGLAGNDSLQVAGEIDGSIEAGSSPAAFKALFAGAEGEVDPAAVRKAWEDVGLKGRLALKKGRLSVTGQPMKISGLELECGLAGGGLESIKAGFVLGGRPWSIEGSAKGIFPCALELIALSGEGEKKGAGGTGGKALSAGALLDKVKNTPTVSLRLKGRAFDARPFSDAKKKKKPAATTGTAAGKTAGDAPPPAGIAGILLLNTSFSAAIDSVITEKATFTSVGCEGSAVRGIMKVRKIGLDYAGGKGTGSGEIDLRDYPKVASRFDIRFSGVQADRALVRMHSLGALLKGTFSFATSGQALMGPGVDPLAMLSAAGDATSTSGVLDLSGFLAPVSSAFNIDISSLEKVDFRSWTGKYFIRDGRLTTEDWQMISGSGNWDIAGSFGFDGSLDYRARLVIPPSVQAGMKDLSKFGDLVDLFKDQKGNIVLDFDIGGNARDPKVQLDQTAARAKAGEKLIDNLKEGGVDKLKSLFKKKKE